MDGSLISIVGLLICIVTLWMMLGTLDRRISKLEAALNPNNGGDE